MTRFTSPVSIVNRKTISFWTFKIGKIQILKYLKKGLKKKATGSRKGKAMSCGAYRMRALESGVAGKPTPTVATPRAVSRSTVAAILLNVYTSIGTTGELPCPNTTTPISASLRHHTTPLLHAVAITDNFQQNAICTVTYSYCSSSLF